MSGSRSPERPSEHSFRLGEKPYWEQGSPNPDKPKPSAMIMPPAGASGRSPPRATKGSLGAGQKLPHPELGQG